jgi:hypothetical protein
MKLIQILLCLMLVLSISLPARAAECKTDMDCPEGLTCIDALCMDLNQNSEPVCSTAEDCEDGFYCIKGMCLPEEDGSCDEDSDCQEDELCVWNSCNPAQEFCTTDSDCADFESCRMECVLYNYAEEGGQGECASEIGFCKLNPEKVEVPEACVAFCDALAPCMAADMGDDDIIVEDVETEGGTDTEQDGGSSGSEGKEDDITDEELAEAQEECELFCAIGMMAEDGAIEMEALVDCVAGYETCEEMETECQEEAEAFANVMFETLGIVTDSEEGGTGGNEQGGGAFGLGGGSEPSTDKNDDGSETEQSTSDNDSGCGVATLPTNPASLLILLMLAGLVLLISRWTT